MVAMIFIMRNFLCRPYRVNPELIKKTIKENQTDPKSEVDKLASLSGLTLEEVKSKLPKWILTKENPSKPKDLISKLKPAEIKKKTPVKLVKKGRTLGENSFFTTKKVQPLISDTIGTNTRKRQLRNGSSANPSDSHFVSTIPTLVEDSEDENPYHC